MTPEMDLKWQKPETSRSVLPLEPLCFWRWVSFSARVLLSHFIVSPGHYGIENLCSGGQDMHNFISSGFVTLGRGHLKGKEHHVCHFTELSHSQTVTRHCAKTKAKSRTLCRFQPLCVVKSTLKWQSDTSTLGQQPVWRQHGAVVSL